MEASQQNDFFYLILVLQKSDTNKKSFLVIGVLSLFFSSLNKRLYILYTSKVSQQDLILGSLCKLHSSFPATGRFLTLFEANFIHKIEQRVILDCGYVLLAQLIDGSRCSEDGLQLFSQNMALCVDLHT